MNARVSVQADFDKVGNHASANPRNFNKENCKAQYSRQNSPMSLYKWGKGFD